MSEHTPGPWVTKGFRIWELAKFGQSRTGIVAQTSIAWRTSKETEANANLLAAAPDLLKALQDLAAKDHPPEYAPEVVRAGNVITKALGHD